MGKAMELLGKPDCTAPPPWSDAVRFLIAVFGTSLSKKIQALFYTVDYMDWQANQIYK